jgi:hypothetical protein
MSLEILNTITSLLTVIIVAATAIAALSQLRHLRAGNQINAMLSVFEKLDEHEFKDALTAMNSGIESALTDPAFRAYEISIFRRVPPPQVEQRYVDMHHAIVLVGNTFEMLGNLIKNKVIDADPFVDQYCGVAFGAWKRLADYVAFGREASGTNASWENFEYLAALSEDWIERHPSSYPVGVRRMQIHNPWPVAPSQ